MSAFQLPASAWSLSFSSNLVLTSVLRISDLLPSLQLYLLSKLGFLVVLLSTNPTIHHEICISHYKNSRCYKWQEAKDNLSSNI